MKKLSQNWIQISVIFIAIIIITILVSVFLQTQSIMKGAVAVANNYNISKETARDNTNKEFYQKGFAKGEAKYHVSNKCVINIDEIIEKSDLEVLQISDTIFVENTDKGKKVWIKADATGVFTINLKAGEYIVDEERHSVMVRVPKPELNPNNIDVYNYEKVLFKNKKLSSSTKEGVEIANAMMSQARTQVIKDFTANQDYFEFAQNSAKQLIESMVRSLNCNVTDLNVDVKFYE